LLVIGAFTVTAVNSLTAPSNPITKEEAIEISKRAELVRDGMAAYANVRVGEATFYNSSWVERMKTGHNREIYLRVPEGHDVWQVIWSVHKVVGGYLVIVVVDAETGIIIQETTGVGFRMMDKRTLQEGNFKFSSQGVSIC